MELEARQRVKTNTHTYRYSTDRQTYPERKDSTNEEDRILPSHYGTFSKPLKAFPSNKNMDANLGTVSEKGNGSKNCVAFKSRNLQAKVKEMTMR